MPRKRLIPEPVSTSVRCSVCGLDWASHKTGSNGTVALEECVRLLKQELARRPQPRLSAWPPYQNPGSGYPGPGVTIPATIPDPQFPGRPQIAC